MESYKMEYSDYGSRDICFCRAEDCKTKCKRNKQLKFFTHYIKYCKEHNYPVRYAVSDFQNKCSEYKRNDKQ